MLQMCCINANWCLCFCKVTHKFYNGARGIVNIINALETFLHRNIHNNNQTFLLQRKKKEGKKQHAVCGDSSKSVVAKTLMYVLLPLMVDYLQFNYVDTVYMTYKMETVKKKNFFENHYKFLKRRCLAVCRERVLLNDGQNAVILFLQVMANLNPLIK